MFDIIRSWNVGNGVFMAFVNVYALSYPRWYIMENAPF